MHANFHRLVERCEQFNQQKQQRALAVMNRYGQQVFQLLPVLLHYHHPLLPGYVPGDVPAGICRFAPNPCQREFIDELCRAANGHQGLAQDRHEILGLYSMGSTSSIGQGRRSDLDIWVCHSHAMTAERVALLQQKCLLISKWAEQRRVELNFFLIPDNKFRTDNQQWVEGESCGSAQHLLLLDEFYRSHLRIAGKRLVWLFAPGKLGPEYDRFVAEQFANGTLNHDDWLDLGGFARIPAEEYFGSALWQLYKSIDSPYKAVLKTVLMEAYSHEYPDTQLLCRQHKAVFQTAESLDETQDHYVLMLEKVTDYLKSIGDEKRLDLVRRCFYLKVSEALEPGQEHDEAFAWRRRTMDRLIALWDWPAEKLAKLDDRNNWKVEEVRAAYGELLEALMQSYRSLIQFARRNNISESINPEDIGILSRKLYAAFENLPGKVQLINLRIAPNLSEPDISLVQVPKGRANQAGWYLYKYGLSPVEILGRSPLEHSDYASRLVAWAHFNGLLTEQTQWHLFNQSTDLDLQHLQEFSRDLARVFPVRLPAPTNLALSRPCEVRHLGIFLNLEQDPTALRRDRPIEFGADTSDPFSFGRQRENLVGSVDIIYRNSWDEIRTLHFEGETAVVDALTAMLGKMHQGASPPDKVDVFCYSRHFRSLLRTRFEQLVKECIGLRLEPAQGHRLKRLMLGPEQFGIFFERRGVSVKRMEAERNGAMREPSPLGAAARDATARRGYALRLDQHQRPPVPEVVDAYASEGLMQFFFENSGEGYNLYILDEANRTEVYHQIAGSKDELVQSINRFYTANQEQGEGRSHFSHFNLPQYYEIVREDGEQRVLTYRTSKDDRDPLRAGPA
ncbi:MULTISPECIES: class I adenylate cyclase [Oceanimonas]|uniref:Adenylate cyclase n=1 Tax=Oceanimonas doudoroffii TaxID=84158 RepID=A0A233RE67_9GAMM|nr:MULTISPECIES: class I adenylate cyclase [Oceanimonas]NHH99224.1 Adenylate cyclase [Oceanimonas sp. MB9]OXY81685.1 adenylate cyclase [Oceanimonas doudoroffii]